MAKPLFEGAMLAGLLDKLSQKPFMAGAAPARFLGPAQLPDAGDVVMAYPPDPERPNNPGVMAVPCLVLGTAKDGRGRLVLSVAIGSERAAADERKTEIALSQRESLQAAGLVRPVRFRLWDRRTIPWEPGFINFEGGRVLAGRLTDRDFEQARRAYGLQRKIETMRDIERVKPRERASGLAR